MSPLHRGQSPLGMSTRVRKQYLATTFYVTCHSANYCKTLGFLSVNEIFTVFGRVNRVNTPEVNALLLRPAGLPEVPNAKEFREEYKQGREMIR